MVERVNAGDEHWRTQAFDLAHDPLEAKDVFDAADRRQSTLAGELEAYKRRLVDGYARTQGAERPTGAALEKLRELGYAR